MRQQLPREMVKFRADPVLRRAIKLRAAILDVDLQDVIVGVLRAGLSEQIAEVEQRGFVSATTAATAPRKCGRTQAGAER